MYSLDLETECCKPGCPGKTCEHALIVHHSRITVAAVAWRDGADVRSQVFRDLTELGRFLQGKPILGQNAKFDFKMARYHGVPLEIDQYVDDSNLMATASYEKVTPAYLEWYESERKRLNKLRKKGRAHREAGQHSLKTCAPFFLHVDPFWEPENHDNDEYVTKDAVYALLLAEKLEPILKKQGTYDFYRNHLMPWSKMFLRAEERGVLLDFDRINEMEPEAKAKAAQYQAELDKLWESGHAAYRQKQLEELRAAYSEKEQQAGAKLKAPTPERLQKTAARYAGLYEKAAQKIETKVNLGSPNQLKWLLKDHLGLDIRGLDGEESTDKEVLELLAGQGREDVALLLKWREQEKLVGTYFAAYRDLANPKTQTLHPTFGLAGTRTGRTTASLPNLQQVPKELYSIFRARPGYKFVIKDMAAIEPVCAAYYSEDPLLVDLVQKGGDFHGYNCRAILGVDWDLSTLKKEHPEERNLAKEVGLAVLYGAGHMRIFACATKRGFKFTKQECKEAVRRLRDAWPDVTAFKEALDDMARSGEPIENLFGRKRVFEEDEIHLRNFNGLIQSTASDMLLESARRAQEEFDRRGVDAHLLLTVHDAVMFEVPGDRAQECEGIIDEKMTGWELKTAMGLVPLRTEGGISESWAG